ncbi:MAG: hypothetical protein ABIK62_05380 [candidate division WOR-3 bacterium]
MNTLRLIVAFVIILVVVVLVSANLGPESATKLVILGKSYTTSAGVLVILSWIFGILSYLVFALIGEIRLRARLARQRRENETLTRELTELRNLPLAGEETQGQETGDEERT